STRRKLKSAKLNPSPGARSSSSVRLADVITEPAGNAAATSNLYRARFLVKFWVVPELAKLSPPKLLLDQFSLKVVSAMEVMLVESPWRAWTKATSAKAAAARALIKYPVGTGPDCQTTKQDSIRRRWSCRPERRHPGNRVSGRDPH